MNKDLVMNELEETFSAFISAARLFDPVSYNAIPYEGSWTPGQVVQHIVLANEGLAKALHAEVISANREADQVVPQIKSIFLNFDTKFKSPDFILPEARDYDRESHLSKLEKIREDIIKAVAGLQLDQICITFELPGMGHLSRYEATCFVIYHTQRHQHQLSNIAQFLKLA